MSLRNLTDCVTQAKLAVENIGMENLDALEVGNEPDLYSGQFPNKYGDWSPKKYVQQ
jgi:hypothetical protein